MPGRHANTGDYRYGFQGQEMDDEVKGEGNSVNYTFRMHDPRVGRFFAVDPLFREYPYYTPYSFSGNRVIDAVELEGLEPKTIIEEGRLTQSVKMFMKPALNVSQASLENVMWYTQTNYKESGKDGPIDSRVARNALSTHGAITISSETVVYRDSYTGYSASFFIGLIAHEQTHVIQYLQFGYSAFIGKYLTEVSKYGYRDAPMEVRAYNIGDAMDDWLINNPNVIDLLNTDRCELNAIETTKLNNEIETAGKKFRLYKGIDTEIAFWANAASNILKQLKSEGTNLENSPPMVKQIYDAYRKEITDLQIERENLKEELNEK